MMVVKEDEAAGGHTRMAEDHPSTMPYSPFAPSAKRGEQGQHELEDSSESKSVAEPVVKKPSLPRTASSRSFMSSLPSGTDGPVLKKLQDETVGQDVRDRQDSDKSNAPAVPSLEVEMMPARQQDDGGEEKGAKSRPDANQNGSSGGKRVAGDVLSNAPKDDPLYRAGFQTVVVALAHPIEQLQQWVVSGLVHWELNGVKQISNTLMYFIRASEIQLLTVDGPVPAPIKGNPPLQVMLEPLKRIRHVAHNRREIKTSQFKHRILEDIVEAKSASQQIQMPPCFAWPFALAWWKKCTKKRKLDDDTVGSSKDSKEISVDFTKCYGCGNKIREEVFMYLDHSFCSEKCRMRQMRRPYRHYTARQWMT